MIIIIQLIVFWNILAYVYKEKQVRRLRRKGCTEEKIRTSIVSLYDGLVKETWKWVFKALELLASPKDRILGLVESFLVSQPVKVPSLSQRKLRKQKKLWWYFASTMTFLYFYSQNPYQPQQSISTRYSNVVDHIGDTVHNIMQISFSMLKVTTPMEFSFDCTMKSAFPDMNVNVTVPSHRQINFSIDCTQDQLFCQFPTDYQPTVSHVCAERSVRNIRSVPNLTLWCHYVQDTNSINSQDQLNFPTTFFESGNDLVFFQQTGLVPTLSTHHINSENYYPQWLTDMIYAYIIQLTVNDVSRSIYNKFFLEHSHRILLRMLIEYHITRNKSALNLYSYYYGDWRNPVHSGWGLTLITRRYRPIHKFGPRFSSDNAGDGPSMDEVYSVTRRIPLEMQTPTKSQLRPRNKSSEADDDELFHYEKLPETIPERALKDKPYSTSNYSRWAKDFRMALPGHLTPILDGTEECHEFPEYDDVTGKYNEIFSGNRLANFRASIQRHQFVYRALYHSITHSEDARKEEAMEILNKYSEYEPYAVWEELYSLHNDASVTNKLQSVQALLLLKQKPGETDLAYKTRHDETFRRLRTLHVTFEDIQVAQYITGLDAKYSTLVENLCIVHGQDLTMESAYRAVVEFNQRTTTRANAHLALSAQDSSSTLSAAGVEKVVEKAVSKATALFTKTINKMGFTGGGGSGGSGKGKVGGGKRGGGGDHRPKSELDTNKPGKRGGLDHDVSANKFGPTDWEKTQTCSTCQGSGHVSRTCLKNETFLDFRESQGLQRLPKGGWKRRNDGGGNDKRTKKKVKGRSYLAVVTGYSEPCAYPDSSPPSRVVEVQEGNMSSSHPSGPERSSDSSGDGPSEDDDPPLGKRSRHTRAAHHLLKFTADSGCTHHMVPIELSHLLTQHQAIAHGTVNTAGSHELPIKVSGRLGSLRKVIGVEGLSRPLLSIRQACEEGNVVVFDRHGVKFYPESSVICSAPPTLSGTITTGQDYQVSVDPHERNSHHAYLASVTPHNHYTMWHQRLGHLGHRVLFNMVKHHAVEGMKFESKEHFQRQARNHQCNGLCHGCVQAKMTRAPQSRRPKGQQAPAHPGPGRLVFADVLFSTNMSVKGHYSCALLLVDCDTKYLWVYPMQHKGEAPTKIAKWIEWMNAHGKPVTAMTTLRSDNGTEFVNAELDEIIASQGLKRSLAAPYAHCHTAERAIRTVQASARAMMLAASITPGFWAEALEAAVYTLNRVPTSTNRKQTRYELFHHVKPNIENIRTFGCEVWMSTHLRIHF